MLTTTFPGKVSRGATRGNQGQKGVLTPPNPDGCSLNQPRVPPGVLTVLLNRQATKWFYWRLWFGDDEKLPELNVRDTFTSLEITSRT
jgi:hypothetical protein